MYYSTAETAVNIPAKDWLQHGDRLARQAIPVPENIQPKAQSQLPVGLGRLRIRCTALVHLFPLVLPVWMYEQLEVPKQDVYYSPSSQNGLVCLFLDHIISCFHKLVRYIVLWVRSGKIPFS
jgi:hypothetical protein